MIRLTVFLVAVTVCAVVGTTGPAAQAAESAHVIQLVPSVRSDVARDRLSAHIQRELRVTREYVHVLNGFVANLDEREVQALSQHPSVLNIVRDEPLELLLPQPSNEMSMRWAAARQKSGSALSGDPVIDLIRAGEVWDGSATGNDGHLGEGVVVGVTGTGISGGHPAFAGTGDDGYTHVNPLGDGVYLGECFATPDLTCNSKLIGRYSFVDGLTSEQPDGGSNRAAGQAVGNRLTTNSVDSLGLPLVTGVAPHANLIVYRTCVSTCQATSIISAFEQAITDDVDVLIHFIASGSNGPWNDLLTLAGLALRANGISLAYITGNSGPEPGTLNLALAAPWTATFISSTHGRSNQFKRLTRFMGGDTAPPNDLVGGSLGGTGTAPIVYAGNLDVPVADAALCLEPFPPDTLQGEILVCDRGQIARVQKALNAVASGAGGFVLANVPDGVDSISSDVYPIPGIHLNAADSTELRAWLASGDGHTATIALNNAPPDPALADRLYAPSSRGPLPGLDYLAPSVAVPAVDVATPTALDAFELATGPASGPGGGAIALVKSARPDWTDAQVLSALMTTGVAPLSEQFEDVATTPFDHGGGRIDVAAAVQAGLLLDESVDGFIAANPDQGGKPSRMNLPGLVSLSCVQQCDWSRRLTATAEANWTAVVETDIAGAQVSVIPGSFSLREGEEQTIDVIFNLGDAPEGVRFGSVLLVPDVAGLSPTRLTLAVDVTADQDLDGVADTADNCLARPNADQRDSDADGFGNACDTDLNNDLITNFIDVAAFGQRFQSDDGDADFNGDGKVDFVDFDRLIEFFLLPPGPSGLL